MLKCFWAFGGVSPSLLLWDSDVDDVGEMVDEVIDEAGLDVVGVEVILEESDMLWFCSSSVDVEDGKGVGREDIGFCPVVVAVTVVVAAGITVVLPAGGKGHQ